MKICEVTLKSSVIQCFLQRQLATETLLQAWKLYKEEALYYLLPSQRKDLKVQLSRSPPDWLAHSLIDLFKTGSIIHRYRGGQKRIAV